jgi:hypothetical protein
MTQRPYNPIPFSQEQRRPVFPMARQQSGGLFLGWGPKV